MLIYLSFFSLSIMMLYFFEEKKNVSSIKFFFIIFILIAFIYLLQAFQYGVGTDYFAYKSMYLDQTRIDTYYNNREYVFSSVLYLIDEFKLGSQAVFYFTSFYLSVCLAVFLCLMKKSGYKAWLILFIFLFVTAIFHNQMNTLRSQMGIALIPIIFLFITRSKWLIVSLLVTLSIVSHQSSILVITILFAWFIYKIFNEKAHLLLSFILTLFIYWFLMSFSKDIVHLIFPRYEFYFDSSYAEPRSILNILTKLYYLPLFVLAYIKYKGDKSSKFNSDLFRFGLFMFCSTYWIIITMLQYGFMSRFVQMFIIFYIFPIYYVVNYYIEKEKHLMVVSLLLYMLFPYILKVVFFPQGEYLYTSIFHQ